MMIRRAVNEDARRIAEIHVSSWQVAYDSLIPADYLNGLSVARREAVWLAAIDEARGPVFVSSVEDRIVGFCHVAPSRDEDSVGCAEITAIYVAPSFWRQGHGHALCEEAVSYAEREAFCDITLWVIAENRRARRFYERMGFLEDGGFKSVERPGFVLNEVRYRRKITVG
ncbi:MAG: GNAT family N-acetyltransferase [Verrucomicrobiae bacterium]|nr:GNAT family N-acetyltransferase [Verrucomicrobiae bacterium]